MTIDPASKIYYKDKKYSLETLEQMVTQGIPVDKVISDFCGTAYGASGSMKSLYATGILRREFKNTSNFDFITHLALIMLKKAAAHMSIKEVGALARYSGRTAKLFNDYCRGLKKDEIIRKFSEDVLNGIPPEYIEMAAADIAQKYAYPESPGTYELLSASKEIVFVSLSLKPNIEAYLKMTGIDGRVFGNQPGNNGATILNPQHKAEIAYDEFMKSNGAVLIINGHDDLGMLRAFEESGKPGFTVAINPETPEVVKSAEIVADMTSFSKFVYNAHRKLEKADSPKGF